MFEVISTNLKDEVKLKVIHGGYLSSKKGVNLPNTKISQPSLTEKDKKDLQVILDHNSGLDRFIFCKISKRYH